MPDLPPKQLSMSVTAAAIARLPDVPLPAGYTLRGFRPGDEAGWAALNIAAGFEGWTPAKILEFISEPERRPGSRAVEYQGTLVAATLASRRRLDPPEGALDYVVCHPDHQNRRLGRAVCTAVLRYLKDRNYATVTLQTDDWRLPAIKLYHNLGFRPITSRTDMPTRWQAVYEKLGLSS